MGSVDPFAAGGAMVTGRAVGYHFSQMIIVIQHTENQSYAARLVR
jgi:hypothetical protein